MLLFHERVPDISSKAGGGEESAMGARQDADRIVNWLKRGCLGFGRKSGYGGRLHSPTWVVLPLKHAILVICHLVDDGIAPGQETDDSHLVFVDAFHIENRVGWELVF